MARTKTPERKPAGLTLEQMQKALPKLQRRINDLETFDVSTIKDRFDPVVEALEKKITGTLHEILGHDTIEYHEYSIDSLDTLPLIMGGGPSPLRDVHSGYREGIERATTQLKTLKEILEERIEDESSADQSTPPSTTKPKSNVSTRRVFLVHGHDNGTKEAVARFITKIKLNPVILHEQANQGKTVIEKFEAHADVDFAVILFTPDDIGYAAGKESEAKPRARQNVVLELGFFMAALGRQRVCVLYKGNVEIPSDYSGVLYLQLDDAGAWKYMLANEMKSVGISVDVNDVG